MRGWKQGDGFLAGQESRDVLISFLTSWFAAFICLWLLVLPNSNNLINLVLSTRDPHTFFPLKTKPRLNRSTNKSSLSLKREFHWFTKRTLFTRIWFDITTYTSKFITFLLYKGGNVKLKCFFLFSPRSTISKQMILWRSI